MNAEKMKREHSIKRGESKAVSVTRQDSLRASPMLYTPQETTEPFSDNLDMRMRARVEEQFFQIDSLSSGAGKELHLPTELKQTIEGHFGHTVDNVFCK